MPSIGVTNAPSLLLLPSPPEPATAESVRAAYHEPLDSIIARLSNENQSGSGSGVTPILVVAIASPVLAQEADGTRRVYWQKSQSLLATVYSAIVAICAKRLIATDVEAGVIGAVDVRVLLVDYDRGADSPYKPNSKGDYEPNNTTVLDLATFSSTVYPWRQIFHPSSERGYELLHSFLKYGEKRQRLQHKQLIAVKGGLSLSISPCSLSAGQETGECLSGVTDGYTTVCLGGTFDHLHPGHKLFLHAAVLLLNIPEAEVQPGKKCELVVGISSDELLAKKKYAEELQSWDVRARSVLNFLSTLLSVCTIERTQAKYVHAETKELHALYRNGSIVVRCVDFHDVYGPTVKEEAIQALVVSGETRSGGKTVNEKRVSQGWHALDIHEIDVLDARVDAFDGMKKDDGTTSSFEGKVSSTEIRKQRAKGRRSTP